MRSVFRSGRRRGRCRTGRRSWSRWYLYIGFGDGGSEGDPNQTSQNPKLRLGKLLRSATTTPNQNWKMIGLGLRNPWRFSFDSHDNPWIADVGQDHWEEVEGGYVRRLITPGPEMSPPSPPSGPTAPDTSSASR
jgi:hypothetical protein